MSSANVSFDSIPSSIRKPGDYFEFNTKLAVRTLSANSQTVLLVGQRLATGSVAANVPTDIYSDSEASKYFGEGSQLHLMAKAAIKSYGYLSLTAIAVDDAAAGIAAAGKLTFSGPASGAGTVKVWIGDVRIDIAVSSADTSAVIAAAAAAALTDASSLPVTATAAAGVVTVMAKNKGLAGNGIFLDASCDASGASVVVTAMTGGANDPDLTATLAAVQASSYTSIVCPFATSDALTATRTFLDYVSGPMEQRPATAVAGWSGSLSSGTTLAKALDSGRISIAWHRGSKCQPCEIAAGYAAVIASEEDPARPLNTLPIAALDVTSVTNWPSRTEQEAALRNGVTPLEIGSGNTVQIVRAITTYTTNTAGVSDVSLLDLTTIRTLDYVRKSCSERIALRFPREKLSSRSASKARSELLDVLLKLEELEIVENVADNAAGLIVERDAQDVNRLNAKIPTDVVNGLHVFAGRIDLLL